MDFKVTDIAKFLNGEVVGDETITVNNVSKIEEGKPGTLAFLSNMKYEQHIYTTKASVVLVNKSFVPKSEIKATLLKVDDAYKAFASLLDLYVQAKANNKTGIEQPSHIHESVSYGENIYVGAFSYISSKVQIGNNVKIFPQVFIGENVRIGDNSILYAGVKIYDDSVIGNQCILHSGVVIGADGFGFAPQPDGTYKKIHQIGNVILEDDVEIGANTTIDCGTMGSTIIRKGVKLDNLIQIAHNCDIGDHTVMAAQTGIAGSAKIGKNCVFAGQSGMAGHLSVGDKVTVGAQGGVLKNLPENSVVWGTPAINLKDQIRALSVFKNLPKLDSELFQIKKEIRKLKNPEN